MAPLELSIVTVNYNSSGVLTECLESLAACKVSLAYEIIVVDNASPDRGLVVLKPKFPTVRFIESAVNHGYAGGVNLGIRASTGRAVLMLNPDTQMIPGTLERLYERLMSVKEAGIAGPKVFYADGRSQTVEVPKKIPTLFDFFCEIFYFNRLFKKHPVINGYYGGGMDYEKEQFIGQVHGSCFMVKRELLDKIGLLDPGFFLYLDEADFCLRALKAGYRSLYVPSASIIHQGGVSAKRTGRRRIFFYYDSQLLFFRKHYGMFIALCFYLMNLFGSLFRLMISPFFLLRDKNTTRAGEMFWAVFYFWDFNHIKRVFKS